MAAEFGTVDEACFFCGQEKTVLFNEHYTFCPNCAVIYTKLSVACPGSCKHYKKSMIDLIRKPMYKSVLKDKAYSYNHKCSVCKKFALGDGW